MADMVPTFSSQQLCEVGQAERECLTEVHKFTQEALWLSGDLNPSLLVPIATVFPLLALHFWSGAQRDQNSHRGGSILWSRRGHSLANSEGLSDILNRISFLFLRRLGVFPKGLCDCTKQFVAP